jgi:hypothetical protein
VKRVKIGRIEVVPCQNSTRKEEPSPEKSGLGFLLLSLDLVELACVRNKKPPALRVEKQVVKPKRPHKI